VILLSSGCGLLPTRTEVVYVVPPMSLLQPTPTPEFNGNTYADIINAYVPDLIGALRECNSNINSTRFYIEEKMKQ